MAPVYKYKARNAAGGREEGLVNGETENEVAKSLIIRGLYPTEIVKTRKKHDLLKIMHGFFSPASFGDRLLFTTQLAALFKAGIPLIGSLDTIAAQSGSGKMAEAALGIKADVIEGVCLSEAMKSRGDMFSEVYTAIIAAGESSGSLDSSLDNLVIMLERENDLNRRIRDVTRYPKIVLAGMFTAIVIIMNFVAPKFISIFEKADLELPLATRALFFISDFFQNHWFAVIEIFLAVYIISLLVFSTKDGRIKLHTAMIKAPVTGAITRDMQLAKWLNVLAALIKSGMPIIQSLAISSRVTENERLAQVITSVREKVADGSGLTGPLREHRDVIPPVVTQMVASGEQSGKLDEMLLKASLFLDNEARGKIKAVSVMAESAVIVALGLLVMFLALAIFTPMWDMTKMARGG